VTEHTRTSRFVEREFRRSLGLDATAELPDWDQAVNRFQFRSTGKAEYDAEGLSRNLIATWPRPIFVDTSLFDLRTADHVWDALLTVPGRLALIPPVAHELAPWIQRNREHRAAAWLANNLKDLMLVDPASFRTGGERAFDFYHLLLGMRKFEFQRRAAAFEQQTGHPVTEDQMKEVRAQLQQELGERGYLIANKGKSISLSESDGLELTDECLVVLAVLTAIHTGRSVMVLTKDEDIIEQVFRLTGVLEAHYKSMWFGRRFAEDRSAFELIDMPWHVSPVYESIFQPEPESYLINTPQAVLDQALPSTWKATGVMCILLGDARVSAFSAVMETGYSELMEVKALTLGMNTDLLGSHNCHSSLGVGLPNPKKWKALTAVAMDRTQDQLSDEGTILTRLSYLDIEMATAGVERFS
jgi:hypothetical protein